MIANRIVQVIGVLAILMGLLWIGQGTGIVRWPVDMVDMRPWAWRGAFLAVAGVLLIWWAGRRKY